MAQAQRGLQAMRGCWDFILRLIEVTGAFFNSFIAELSGLIYHIHAPTSETLFGEKGSDEIKFLHIRVLSEFDNDSLIYCSQ